MYYFDHLHVDCLGIRFGLTCDCVLRDVYIGSERRVPGPKFCAPTDSLSYWLTRVCGWYFFLRINPPATIELWSFNILLTLLSNLALEMCL